MIGSCLSRAIQPGTRDSRASNGGIGECEQREVQVFSAPPRPVPSCCSIVFSTRPCVSPAGIVCCSNVFSTRPCVSPAGKCSSSHLEEVTRCVDSVSRSKKKQSPWALPKCLERARRRVPSCCSIVFSTRPCVSPAGKCSSSHLEEVTRCVYSVGRWKKKKSGH